MPIARWSGSVFWLLLASLLFSAGCAAGSRERKPWYFWGLYNASDHKISNIRWHYRQGDASDASGKTAMRAGQASSYGPGFAPIPQRVTVEWWSYRDGERSQEVAVAETIPDLRRFKGTIWLRYDGQGWETVPMTDEQATQRAIDQVENATVPDPANFP